VACAVDDETRMLLAGVRRRCAGPVRDANDRSGSFSGGRIEGWLREARRTAPGPSCSSWSILNDPVQRGPCHWALGVKHVTEGSEV